MSSRCVLARFGSYGVRRKHKRVLRESLVTMTAVAALMGIHHPASAQSPTGGAVVAGSAGIAQAGAVTNINQSSQKAVINWQGFSVGAQNTVNFNQPNSSAATLNRVIGNEQSVINGAINANGQVFIVNSNGVLFGKGSQVNVGGLVASTLDISNNDFMAGNYKFSGTSNASVVNQGRIRAHGGGYVALLGKTVSNEGVISAKLGTVAMAAGEQITLNFGGDSLLDVTIDKGTLNALVANKRAIIADGGQVIMTAKAADQVLSAQVNNTGIIQARTMAALKGGSNAGKVHIGKIKLLAQGGTTNVSGKLDASALKGGDGGFIETSGDQVNIADNAVITTKAASGNSGTWLIDPYNITISNSPTSNGNFNNGSPNTYTPTGTSVVNVAMLQTALANGNVVITTGLAGSPGTDAGDINVNAAVSWSANRLTLNAAGSIYVNAVMTASGTADFTATYGTGANADGSPNGIYMAMGQTNGVNDGTFAGKLNFSGTGALILDGQAYTVVNSLSDLQSKTTADPSKFYALGSDLSPGADPAYVNGINPVVAATLTGALDGLGHTISDITISRSASNNGVIAGIGATSLIRNVGVVNITITNGTGTIGALVGRGGGGSVINTFASGGSINVAAKTVGGLVGVNFGGLIANSWSSVNVIGQGTVGGLVGNNSNLSAKQGTIINSYATGSVDAAPFASARTNFGGLVGQNTYGLIRNSYATGDVLMAADDSNIGIANSSNSNGVAADLINVGGLVGLNSSNGFGKSTISYSHADGKVASTANNLGGLVGRNQSSSIDHSYATGTVTSRGSGANNVGGLVGLNDIPPNVFPGSGEITYSYATGDVFAPNSTSVGGIAGRNDGLIKDSQYIGGTVTGGQYVGGVAGWNTGSPQVGGGLDTVTASGTIIGSSRVGGVVGQNSTGNVNYATVANATFSGSVSGNNEVGGIAGYNAGNLQSSSASGVINGNVNVGGIAGYNAASQSNQVGGTVNDSHSTSTVIGNDDATTGSSFGHNDNTDPNTVNNSGGTGSVSTPTSRAEAAAQAAAEASAKAEAERQAAEAAAARQAQAEQGVRTANAVTNNVQTSSLTPPDPSLAKAGAAAAKSEKSAAIEESVKSVDDAVKADDKRAKEERERKERQRRAAAQQRGDGRAGSGGNFGATIRSIDVDGQRFNLENGAPKQDAPAQAPQ